MKPLNRALTAVAVTATTSGAGTVAVDADTNPTADPPAEARFRDKATAVMRYSACEPLVTPSGKGEEAFQP